MIWRWHCDHMIREVALNVVFFMGQAGVAFVEDNIYNSTGYNTLFCCFR